MNMITLKNGDLLAEIGADTAENGLDFGTFVGNAFTLVSEHHVSDRPPCRLFLKRRRGVSKKSEKRKRR